MTDLGADLYNVGNQPDLGSDLYGTNSSNLSLIEQALQPIEDIPKEYAKQRDAGYAAMTAPAPAGHYGQDYMIPRDLVSGVGDAASRVGGTLQWGFSPLTGMISALAAKPAGNIAKSAGMSPQNAQNYVETPIDFAGGLLAPGAATKYLPDIMAAAKAIPGAVKSIPDMLAALSEDDMVQPLVKAAKYSYDPSAVHSSISATYGAAKDNASAYYDFMNQLAKGKTADASGIKNGLESVISDIENTPFHEASSELPYLKKQVAKIGDENDIPLSDIVDIKKSLNANFNPKRFTNGSDTPYQFLGSSVDASLKQASKTYPEFGEAKTLADKNWLNTVKSPFEDNKVLQKFWEPEDYYAQKSVDNGMLEELPDPTKQRAAMMLTKIKNPVQLNSVRRVLPDEHADALAQAKIDEITKGRGRSRANSAGKAVYNTVTGHWPSALRNTADVINPSYNPAQQELLKAAQSAAPKLSTKYSQPFQDLKTKVANPPPKLLTYQPQEAMPTDILVGRGTSAGKARILSQEEQNAIAAKRLNETNLGIDSGVRNAQFKNAQSAYEEENPESSFFNEMAAENSPVMEAKKPGFTFIDPTRSAYEQSQAERWVKELERMDADPTPFPSIEENPYLRMLGDAGYKKGGIVEKRKAAQYKKHAEALILKLNRTPKATEVELAHYVGPHGVKRLLGQKNLDMPAHKMFPKDMVTKNRELFFKGRKPYAVRHLQQVLG